MYSILVIDDSADLRETICDILVDAGYDVFDAACPDDAFQILKRERFDLVICDLHMPFTMGKDFFDYAYGYEVGLRTVKELRWVFPHMPIVVVSATVTEELDEMMKEMPEIPALSKPISPSKLLETVRLLLSPVPESVEQLN